MSQGFLVLSKCINVRLRRGVKFHVCDCSKSNVMIIEAPIITQHGYHNQRYDQFLVSKVFLTMWWSTTCLVDGEPTTMQVFYVFYI